MEYRHFFNSRSASSPYWNPQMETLPREQLDAVHLQRIQKLLAHAYSNCPLYRRLYDAAGVTPAAIRSLEDFARYVPSVSTQDLTAAQTVHPPYGDAMALRDDDLLFRFQSQGNGGPNLDIPLSYYGSVLYGEPWVYLFWAAGLRADSTFYLPFHWDIGLGLWSAYFGVRRLGATMLSGGGLDTTARLQQIEQRRPQALLITPGEAIAMADAAQQEGINVRASSISHIFTCSEAGCCNAALRRKIEEAWNARVYDLYLHNEVGGMAAGFHSSEGLHAVEDCGYSLVLDGDNLPASDGSRGELLFTSYMQMAQPIIKYRTRDVVEVHRGPSTDGRTWMLFKGGVLGHTD